MRSALAVLLVAPLLAGCNLDVLEGKESPAKLAHEQRLAMMGDYAPSEPVETDPPAVLTVVDVEPPAPEPEPIVVTLPDDPWPLIVDTAPECVPVFRVTTCD